MQKDEGRLFNTIEAGELLGIHESSVRRLAIAMERKGTPIGRKLNGRAWLFSELDIRRLRERDDLRGHWQRHGGRRSYLDRLIRERGTRPGEG